MDLFLNDSSFGDTVLDFNLYFLGTQANELWTIEPNGSRRYSEDALVRSSAVHSAQEYLKDGNYLTLLQKDHPLFLPQGEEPRIVPQDQKEEQALQALSWKQKRARIIQGFLDRFDKGFKELEPLATQLSAEDFCRRYFGDYGSFDLFQVMLDLGVSSVLLNSIYYSFTEEPNCANQATPQEHLRFLVKMREAIVSLQEIGDEIDPSHYQIEKLSDIRRFDSRSLGIPPVYTTFSFTYWFENQNSSTNMNRRRAATFLSRYFCDDLTPIQFLDQSDHTQGKHGSDPACLACHYKLDPMAGFFKSFGQFGFGQKGENIRFDDGATKNFDEYTRQWWSDDPSRKWNIGYIRSSDRTHLNSYGESLEDLFQIIAQSEEPKACLVKRATRYFLGEKVLIDSGFEEYLSDLFIQEAKVNSSQAFRKLVKRLILSQTFAENNPDPELCYDYAPGTLPQNRPPCRIASVFVKNCASCHKESSMKGGLDLTRWIEISPGEFSFPHLDSNDTQVSKDETFSRILNRISTSDPQLQMPKRRHISSQHREEIFRWVSDYLEKKK